MAFFKTSRAESNEVVKAEDITFNFDSQVSNFSVLLQSLIDTTSNFVVGGKVSVLSGMNLTIDPILGCAKDTGICFASTEKLTEGVVVSASESQDRIDIVQIKAIEEDYDEQQRSFIDFETKIETIQNVFTKKRVILQVEVKKGTAGSVISPTTDFGWVKLAEIFVPANSTSIDEWNIYNITSNYKGEENENWTNEKDSTYNFQYISEINKEFQNEHNKDGTHKQKVIGASELDYGVGSNQVNTSILPLGTSISVDNNQLSASTTTTMFLSVLAEKISTIFKDYYNKGGVYNFNGEIKISDIFEDNALTKALKIKCDGNGSAFFYVNEKIIFTITESGKFIMPSSYSATASNDVITKAVSDAIYAEIKELEITIDDILNNNAANPAFVNGVFSRFSFSNLDVTVATTENISLFGEQTIDGIPLAANNVVLVKNQTDAKENGIYWVNIGEWDRHADFVDFDSFKNKFFTIGSGLVNKGKVFFTNQQIGTLETDELNFVESFFKNAETKNTVPIRDNNGNIKTGTPVVNSDAAPKSYVDMIANSVIPVGFVYTQWPGQKSPSELKMYGTWEDVSYLYAGLFTRVAGGEATEFNKQLEVITQSGTTLTFGAGHGITTQCLLIDTTTGERRAVTAVSGNTVTVASAFNSSLTTVLIGQKEGLPNIKGSLDMRGMVGGEATVLGTYSGALYRDNYSGASHTQVKDGGSGSYRSRFGFDASKSNSIYGANSHVTPFNLSIKVWQRIS